MKKLLALIILFVLTAAGPARAETVVLNTSVDGEPRSIELVSVSSVKKEYELYAIVLKDGSSRNRLKTYIEDLKKVTPNYPQAQFVLYDYDNMYNSHHVVGLVNFSGGRSESMAAGVGGLTPMELRFQVGYLTTAKELVALISKVARNNPDPPAAKNLPVRFRAQIHQIDIDENDGLYITFKVPGQPEIITCRPADSRQTDFNPADLKPGDTVDVNGVLYHLAGNLLRPVWHHPGFYEKYTLGSCTFRK
ncbi:hypothetical protein C4J81_10455 [Deltaproteobacteria bacterium Smac51]|nr:hypothetical protein C4J81_10455 [Deltaproteobacteria bacterium Smac51]